MLAVTRAWRATSECQPRVSASSWRARTSASCSSSAGRNSGAVTKLSHCLQMGVGAGLGHQVARAVAVSDAGLEHLGAQPLSSGGDGGSAGRSDEEGDPGADLAHGCLVGGADRGRGEGRISERHLRRDVSRQLLDHVLGHAAVDEPCPEGYLH